MKSFRTLKSQLIPLPYTDVDTDQIIPARYLKVIDKSGLAEGLFVGWRYLPDGNINTDFVFNQTQFQDAQILLAGDNFGCGSSREHAPWALAAWGIFSLVEEEPLMQFEVALATQTLKISDAQMVEFAIDEFSKKCLIDGIDQLGYLLKHKSDIIAYEQTTGK